ncbi:MAG TPA: ABC transporter permease, partial [Opitutaceae bacterium]|nr:ABC transporter permease [Opitutaceae bacterium]
MRAWLRHHPELFSLAGLLAVGLTLTFVSDRFLTLENLGNIDRQVSINAIIATGMTLVIITGGIDLSVGAVMTLAMTFGAGAMLAGAPVAGGIAISLLTGLACGALNGALIAYVGLPAIIVTLATMEIPRGVALLYTGGYPLTGLPSQFSPVGRGEVFGVHVPTWIMFGTVIGGHVLLTRFVAGRALYAIGGNAEAARLSGVPVRRYTVLAYTLSGLTAALAGVVLSSRLMSGQPNAGVGFELDAIAAVVLGGTAIAGGRGSIAGTLIGAMLLGVLNNGLNLMNVSPYTQKILKGAII